MGITLPADLAEIAGQVGVQWPQADETAMHNAALAWRTAAAKLTTLAQGRRPVRQRRARRDERQGRRRRRRLLGQVSCTARTPSSRRP
ncbi:hypothetical protein [Kutzneria kofuensis]|uniref:hypothetical protein n=1 Tax=Kutzneria kofuensis TaxID=103725 RepID=UPI0031E73996